MNTPATAVKSFLLLGATGPTGREVIDQGLEVGYTITAFVRDPAKLPVRHARLRVVVGDVTAEGPALEQAVKGQDAVLSALGAGMSFAPRRLMEQAMPRIVAAMEAAGVRRLIFTSAFGVGETYRDTPAMPRLTIATLLSAIYADKRRGEEILERSALDWTLVCPTGLTNGPRTGKYRVGERLELRGFPTISRADVASFLLRELQDPRFLKKEVLISD